MKKITWGVVLLLIIAGSFLAGSWYTQRGAAKNEQAPGRKVLYYVDPMHPAYRSDKPGIAPDCGMELVPVYDDGKMGGAGAAATGPSGTVTINADKQQLLDVRIEEVRRASASHVLRVSGRIAVDEQRLHRIIAVADGWIRELGQNSAGSFVKQNQILASYYARDLLSAQQTLLYNLATNDQRDATIGSQRGPTTLSVQVAVDSLRTLGMSDRQIEEIRRDRMSAPTIHIFAPITGFVMARSVSPGQRFERGTELYRVADLGRIWILADVFRNEARYFRPGVVARVTLPDDPEGAVQARVSEVLPQFDGTARTLKIRLEADNPGFVLRPDMFVDVAVPVTLPPTITVPADAVVDSGVKKTVYVVKGDGVFEPRKVETGWRVGDRVEIVKGLMTGEKVVVSGTFLIDSESRMKAAAAGIYGESSECPVCGMAVDITKAKAAGLASEFRGQTYYFCADEDKVKFDKEPTRYAWRAAEGATTEAGKRLEQVEWSAAHRVEPAHAGHAAQSAQR